MKLSLFYYVLIWCLPCAATDIKFKDYGFVMAHDAATGMLEPHYSAVYKYAQTQRGNLSEQLNCGARALDLRVMLIDGKLEFYHGQVKIDYGLQRGLNDITEWLKKNPHELVVLDWWCHGGCWDSLKDELLDLNLPPLIEDCDALKNRSIHEIRDIASLEQGGYLLSLAGCIEENYNSKIECWGVEELQVYGCTDNTKDDYPLLQFWGYIETTMAAHGDLWMVQAHWQTSLESAALGELHKSSILEDEKKSGINNRFTEAIRDGHVKASELNFVEVDYVCDGGLELLQVLDVSNQQKFLRAHRVGEGSSLVVSERNKGKHFS